MGNNTWETIDNTLRGEPYGQMTPEGQNLWDQYNSLLDIQKNIPMRNLRLRSGATTQIPDIGMSLKNRMLSRTLSGMTGTGLGSRAKAQPGLLSQLAPLFIAAGIKDPNKMKELLDLFRNKSTPSPTDTGELPVGTMTQANDWDNAFSGRSGLGEIGLPSTIDSADTGWWDGTSWEW